MSRLDFSVLTHDDVGRLDVAVHDTFGVCVLQSRCDLHEYLHEPRHRKSAGIRSVVRFDRLKDFMGSYKKS